MPQKDSEIKFRYKCTTKCKPQWCLIVNCEDCPYSEKVILKEDTTHATKEQ